MLLQKDDLQAIRLLFREEFNLAFPPAFDNAFARAFPPAFDKAFDRSFDKKIEITVTPELRIIKEISKSNQLSDSSKHEQRLSRVEKFVASLRQIINKTF